MVGDVERLETELDVLVFAETKVLHHRHVHERVSRTVEYAAAGVAESERQKSVRAGPAGGRCGAGRHGFERARIEPGVIHAAASRLIRQFSAGQTIRTQRLPDI